MICVSWLLWNRAFVYGAPQSVVAELDVLKSFWLVGSDHVLSRLLVQVRKFLVGWLILAGCSLGGGNAFAGYVAK